MKYRIILIFLLAAGTLTAQKTTRETISKVRGVDITRAVTESEDGSKDIRFYMMGQNAHYTQITDIITVKYGSATEIGELLVECIKFLPEKEGTTLEFKGNTIGSTGRNQVIVWGSGSDSRGAVLLNRNQITTLLEDLRKYL